MVDIAASGRCKWLILLLVAAAGGCCKWTAATGSCKCPNIRGSVQTRSLQVDLLQVPIHRPYILGRCKWICCKCPYTIKTPFKRLTSVLSYYLREIQKLFKIYYAFKIFKTNSSCVPTSQRPFSMYASLNWCNFIFKLMYLYFT